MSKFQRLARLVAGALLATGVFASAAAPATAASDTSSSHKVIMLDTGWGG